MRIDHVLWATDDLDATAERFAREHGLPVLGGGRHVGLGTENRILALGGGYLELIAVVDADEAAASWIGRAVADAPEGLIGWAVVVEDVGEHAKRLRAWLGGEELPVRYAEGGPPGVRAVGLGSGAVIR
jgi:Glyoxalase-like domain